MSEQNGHSPGFQMPARTIALEFPEQSAYCGAVVRCRRNLSLQRVLALQRLVEGVENADVEAAARLFADEILLDWNLLDEDGAAIPCTPETFIDQPADFVTVLMVQWIEQITAVPVPLASASPAGSPLAAAGTMPAN